MCSSYQGPSRSPAERPAAASVAATNGPYSVSLSSSAGTGWSRASSNRATLLLPAPGGPATTHTTPAPMGVRIRRPPGGLLKNDHGRKGGIFVVAVMRCGPQHGNVQTRSVLITLFDQVQSLDVTGPLEVFATASSVVA